MPLNWEGALVAAIVPLAVRFAWYDSRFLGRFWKDLPGVAREQSSWGRTSVIVGLSLALGFLMASIVMPLTIHQIHVFSVVQGDPDYGKESAAVTLWLTDFMERYGSSYRTFKHGAVHGAIAGLCLATPMVGIGGLFEGRRLKDVLVESSYWTVTLTLMGAIVCGWK